jgi:hypothetical protein
MSIVYPNIGTEKILDFLVANSMSLKLFSNNIVPAITDVLATYTEVAGGGYAAITLASANWTTTAASPSTALYSALQQFSFTGPTNAPSTIYGYYIVQGSNLILAERFPAGVVPFTPVAGSFIRIRPQISCV